MRLRFLATLMLAGSLAAMTIATPMAYAANREPIAGRTQPVQNTTGRTVKIALISFPESNELPPRRPAPTWG